MCGEQRPEARPVTMPTGSLPRVRGTAPCSAPRSQSHRITPACAGNSQIVSLYIGLLKDRPRVCGEQVCPSGPCGPMMGSPPRVRGTDTPLIDATWEQGITPACAGNRRFLLPRCKVSQDHPRVCGEQVYFDQETLLDMGSPPRVRGTAALCPDKDLRNRITPACAGNRKTGTEGRAKMEDHPRVCGEQSIRHASSSGPRGSPPRVRGTVWQEIMDEQRLRITPACAGNSAWWAAGQGRMEDHPRVCGEKILRWLRARPDSGSPPRVRGKGGVQRPIVLDGRITPACAGNRSARSLTT